MQVESLGAEARVTSGVFCGKECVVKRRLPKEYRHPVLDTRLRKARTLHEARCLVRCAREGVDAPKLYFVDTSSMSIFMELVRGKTAKEALLEEQLVGRRQAIAYQIGSAVGRLHDAGIVHGDLTTSNMIVREKSPPESVGIALIDFGLGAQAVKNPEDKAVDLYVLERALASMHPNSDTELVPVVLKAYRENSPKMHFLVMQRLDQVRKRGRKRLAFG